MMFSLYCLLLENNAEAAESQRAQRICVVNQYFFNSASSASSAFIPEPDSWYFGAYTPCLNIPGSRS